MFQCGSWVLPYWRSFSSSHWCSWRWFWRNQGCKVSFISSWVTPFSRRFFPWCWLHKGLVISIIRDNDMIPLRKGSACLVHELDMLVFALTWRQGYMSPWVTHATWSLVDAQDSSGPTQKSPIVEYSAGEEHRPKAGHVILSLFGSSSMVIPRKTSEAHQLW